MKNSTARATAAIGSMALVAVLMSGCTDTSISAPPSPTPAQIDSMMSEWPAYVAGSTGGTASEQLLRDVTFVRFVSDASWVRTMQTCSAGYGVTSITYHSDFTSTVTADAATDELDVDTVNGACIIKFPPLAVRKLLRSTQQLGYIYSYYQNELLPCLRSHGASVTNVPVRAQFIATAHNGLSMWTPYNPLGSSPDPFQPGASSEALAQVPTAEDTTNSQLGRLAVLCPALPPGV